LSPRLVGSVRMLPASWFDGDIREPAGGGLTCVGDKSKLAYADVYRGVNYSNRVAPVKEGKSEPRPVLVAWIGQHYSWMTQKGLPSGSASTT
jgi:hypothetical protein